MVQAHLPEITAFVSWPSAPLTDRLVRRALSQLDPPPRIVSALPPPSELASQNLLQWATYDDIEHEHTLSPPADTKILSSSYVIRKALIRKHFLSRCAHLHTTKHPESPLKRGIPRTWELELSFVDELDEMWSDELWDLGEELDKGEKWMILKPGMADRGNGLRLFHTKEELEAIFQEFEDNESDEEDDTREEAEAQRDDTAVVTSQLRHFVIQEYLDNPLLLDPSQIPIDGVSGAGSTTDRPQGRKFHIRAYCVASGALSVYVYTRMLALFSAVPYKPPSTSDDDSELDLAAHLTNTSLQTEKGEANVRLLDELIGCSVLSGSPEEKLSHEDVQDIQDQISTLVGEIFQAALGMSVHYQVLPNAFELYGLDFLVSHNDDPKATRKFQVSLLEVNSEPAIELTGPRLTWILEDLFSAIGKVCIVPFFVEKASEHVDGADEAGVLRKCLETKVRGDW